MNRLRQLQEAGVSIRLDTLSRELLETGEFVRLVGGCAVTGATSNRTIFANAITDSEQYDNQLRALIEGGERDSRELFFALGLEDVRGAADQLRSIYEQTEGHDGFVSFECTPDLADDSEATIAQALELWGRLGQPNVMMRAFADHGNVGRALDSDLTEAERVLAPAAEAGLDLAALVSDWSVPGSARSATRITSCLTASSRRPQRWPAHRVAHVRLADDQRGRRAHRRCTGQRRQRGTADDPRLVARRAPLEATLAAGRRLLAEERRPTRLLRTTIPVQTTGQNDGYGGPRPA